MENGSQVSYDTGCLLAEIEELKRIAESRGLGTLAYLLECAAAEAKLQVQSQKDESELRRTGQEPWRPR